MTRVVVGVDGSANSKRALLRALEEAELRGGTLDVVHAFRPPRRGVADDLASLPIGLGVVMGPISTSEPAHDPPSRDTEALTRVRSALERFVADAIAGARGPEPRVVAVPAEHPAEALIEASREADLLVIGTRGLGGFAGMLLGSVAHQCIQHCRCPMLMLPPSD